MKMIAFAPVVITGLAVLAALSSGTGDGWAQTGTLVVTPLSGPVGTTVTISGTGCNNLGQPTLLVFQGGYPSRGTVGALEVPNLTSNTDGTFSGTFVIPTDLHSLQGQGGGPVVPGTYEFVSRPVICMTDFTVTAPALLPDGGGEPIPSTRDIAGQEMVLVGLLLAVLGGLAFRAVLPRNRP